MIRLQENRMIKIETLLDPKTFGMAFQTHAAITVNPSTDQGKLIEKL
jgi:hypothetical protein